MKESTSDYTESSRSPLYDRVVQLCVSVGNFLLAGEELEPLGQPGNGAVPLGQRRHHLDKIVIVIL